MSPRSASCEFVLAYFNGDSLPEWKLGLAEDAEFLIGGDVDGPGRLALPGIAATHARVWRNRAGVWMQAQPRANAWLNGLPLFAGPVSLVKGDRIRLGLPGWENELVTTCTADLNEATSRADPPRSAEDGLRIDDGIEQLSPAEYEVFAWIGRGASDLEEIASRLSRSVHTIRKQIGQVYEKLDVHSKSELIALVLHYRNALEKRNSPAGERATQCDCFR
jgi:DNA-binding CsgD family transcriptional regulator